MHVLSSGLLLGRPHKTGGCLVPPPLFFFPFLEIALRDRSVFVSLFRMLGTESAPFFFLPTHKDQCGPPFPCSGAIRQCAGVSSCPLRAANGSIDPLPFFLCFLGLGGGANQSASSNSFFAREWSSGFPSPFWSDNQGEPIRRSYSANPASLSPLLELVL